MTNSKTLTGKPEISARRVNTVLCCFFIAVSSLIPSARADVSTGVPFFPVQPGVLFMKEALPVSVAALSLLRSITSRERVSLQWHQDSKEELGPPLFLPAAPVLSEKLQMISADPAYFSIHFNRPAQLSLCSEYPVEYSDPGNNTGLEIASPKTLETDNGLLYCSKITSLSPDADILLYSSPYPYLQLKHSTLELTDEQGQKQVISLQALKPHTVAVESPVPDPFGISLYLNPEVLPTVSSEALAQKVLVLTRDDYPVRTVPGGKTSQQGGAAPGQTAPATWNFQPGEASGYSSFEGSGLGGAGGDGGGDDNRRPTDRRGDIGLARMDLNSIVTMQQVDQHVIAMLGTHWDQLSLFLLNDDMGTITESIRTSALNEPERAGKRMLSRWIAQNPHTATWDVLIRTLRMIGLNTLADQLYRLATSGSDIATASQAAAGAFSQAQQVSGYTTPLTINNIQAFGIIQQIGSNYISFGINLLQDTIGMVVGSIDSQAAGNPERALMMIFQRWLNGYNNQPRTWERLIEVLKDIDLNTLAQNVVYHLENGSGSMSLPQSVSYAPVASQPWQTPAYTSPPSQQHDQQQRIQRLERESLESRRLEIERLEREGLQRGRDVQQSHSRAQSTSLSQKPKPTLPVLLGLGIGRRLGNAYAEFGRALLQDSDGVIMQTIQKQHRNSGHAIHTILTRWLQGNNGTPTWEHLLQVLVDINMRELAEEIAQKQGMECPDSITWQANQHMHLLESVEDMDTGIGITDPPPAYQDVANLTALELQRSPCFDEMSNNYAVILMLAGMDYARLGSLREYHQNQDREILINGYSELRRNGHGVSWTKLYNLLGQAGLEKLQEKVKKHHLQGRR